MKPNGPLHHAVKMIICDYFVPQSSEIAFSPSLFSPFSSCPLAPRRLEPSGSGKNELFYSNMAPRLSGQTSIFAVVFFVPKSLWGTERQIKRKEFAIFS